MCLLQENRSWYASASYWYVEVFLDRLSTCSLRPTPGLGLSVQKTVASAVSAGRRLELLLWLFPTAQTVQKTGEIPQVFFLDTVETLVIVQ